MLNLTLEEVVSSWQAAKRREYRSPGQRALELTILRALAQGGRVSPEELADITGLRVEVAKGILHSLQRGGADFDDRGNLIGMVLTLRPTPHEFRVNGRQLYAWCALDTLFLPGLIRQTAKVASTCPVTGEEIRLTVSSEGVEALAPEGTVLSIVVPGHSVACQPGQQGGAQGAVCSSMHFFRDRQAASLWLVGSPDVAVFTVDEAWRLARKVWIEPFITDRLSQSR